MSDSALPHDLDAERALLGACLLNPAQIQECRQLVSTLDFSLPSRRVIWRAMLELQDAGAQVDLVTLVSHLRSARADNDRSMLDVAGGHGRIAALTEGVPKSTHAPSYAAIVADKSYRRSIVGAFERGAAAARDSATEELPAYVQDLQEIIGTRASRSIEAEDLYSASNLPARPEFVVKDLIRRVGLHVVWAQPSAGKTWTLLRIVHEMMLFPGRSRLLNHPELWINRRWKRVLWIATEEDGPTLRYKGDWIRRGLDCSPDGGSRLAGQIRYIWAPRPGHRVTLDDLPAILEREAPLDAVFLDSFTGLRPRIVNGERVQWDRDNDALNELNLRLRGLAGIHQLAIFLIHHTAKDQLARKTGPRGGIDLEASADVMAGLIPDEGRTRIQVGKNRDGRVIPPFLLEPSWTPDELPARTGTYDVKYVGAPVTAKLSQTALRVQAAFLQEVARGVRLVSQRELVQAVPDVSRQMVAKAIAQLLIAGVIHDTGAKTPPPNPSPLYGYGSGQIEPEPAPSSIEGATAQPDEVAPDQGEFPANDDIPW